MPSNRLQDEYLVLLGGPFPALDYANAIVTTGSSNGATSASRRPKRKDTRAPRRASVLRRQRTHRAHRHPAHAVRDDRAARAPHQLPAQPRQGLPTLSETLIELASLGATAFIANRSTPNATTATRKAHDLQTGLTETTRHLCRAGLPDAHAERSRRPTEAPDQAPRQSLTLPAAPAAHPCVFTPATTTRSPSRSRSRTAIANEPPGPPPGRSLPIEKQAIEKPPSSRLCCTHSLPLRAINTVGRKRSPTKLCRRRAGGHA